MRLNLFSIVALALLGIVAKPLLAEAKHKIGVLIPLSGEVAQFGEVVRGGVERGADPRIELVYEDTKCESAHALTAFKKLSLVNGVKYFLGPCCGSPMKTVSPLYREGEYLAMSVCTVSDEAHEASNGSVFFPHYSVEQDAAFNADHMKKMGVERALVVFLDNEFSRAHERAFRKSFTGTVVDSLSFSNFDSSDVKSVALKMKRTDFDGVYVPLVEPFLLGLMTEMKKIGIRDKKVFSVYSVQMPEVLEAEGVNAEGLYYSYPKLTSDVEALSFFPERGARMLSEKILECNGKYSCVREAFKKDKRFDSNGVIADKMILKTVQGGKFIEVIG